MRLERATSSFTCSMYRLMHLGILIFGSPPVRNFGLSLEHQLPMLASRRPYQGVDLSSYYKRQERHLNLVLCYRRESFA